MSDALKYSTKNWFMHCMFENDCGNFKACFLYSACIYMNDQDKLDECRFIKKGNSPLGKPEEERTDSLQSRILADRLCSGKQYS
jgi:hypothetical protein